MKTFLITVLAFLPVIVYNIYMFSTSDHLGIDTNQILISGLLGIMGAIILKRLGKTENL